MTSAISVSCDEGQQQLGIKRICLAYHITQLRIYCEFNGYTQLN